MTLIPENHRKAYRTYSVGKDEAERLYLRLMLVMDHICGMTDSCARSLYQELSGID